jgi:hypothetical protein
MISRHATSGSPPRAISAISVSSIGETSVKVVAEAIRRPPIQCRVSTSTPAAGLAWLAGADAG